MLAVELGVELGFWSDAALESGSGSAPENSSSKKSSGAGVFVWRTPYIVPPVWVVGTWSGSDSELGVSREAV